MIDRSTGEERQRLAPDADAARKRAAVETYSRHEAALRRTARRYSICADDADDALQRGLEILLRKAPTDDPRELIKWTQTVVKHEALAVRRERERILAGPAARAAEPDAQDWVAALPSPLDGPAERAIRHEAVVRSREALQALKPQELRALTLLAEGYSYAEIGELTGYSRTKINRCLAEGRERFRKLISRSEDGSRCEEMGPLLSAFADGEAEPRDAKTIREHLRACPHCRATLRTYRAAPAAAAALAPVLPLHRSLIERAHDALGGIASRFGGGGGDASIGQVAAGGGARGAGVAALAKVAAICASTAGGAAACVATGLVPAPLDLTAQHDRPSAIHRDVQRLEAPVEEPTVEYQPAEPETTTPSAEVSPPAPRQEEESDPATEVAAVPAASRGAVEYTAPPAPEPAPESTGSSGAAASQGDPSGEFGP